MTSKPWMPWYVADFVGDTQHLDAAETGAYMLLLGHYWLNGGKLPEGEAAMARVARMTAAQWKRSRDALLKFFPDGHNKRADEELAHAAEVSSKRRASAKQKHSNSSANAPPNAEQKDTHARATSPSQSQEDAAPAGAPSDEADLFRRGKQVLGNQAGGLIAKLKKAKNGSIPLCRAAIEQAATKENPREYIGRVIAGPTAAVMANGEPHPEGII